MKKLLLTLILAFIAIPAMAADPATTHTDSWLKPVEPKFICMMNNAVFEKEQMAIEVEGKTYYGCCEMCKDKLKNDASARQAVDPISGKTVDKASAVIGEHHGAVYYFENQENFEKFASGPMPAMEEHKDGMNHDHMEGMDMKDMGGMMEGKDKTDATTSPAEPLVTPEDHKQHH